MELYLSACCVFFADDAGLGLIWCAETALFNFRLLDPDMTDLRLLTMSGEGDEESSYLRLTSGELLGFLRAGDLCLTPVS